MTVFQRLHNFHLSTELFQLSLVSVRVSSPLILLRVMVVLACALGAGRAAASVLTTDAIARHVARFNAMEDEPIVNLVSNADATAWLQANIPRFECPDAEVEEIYHFRWWALRKHLRRAPDGSFVFSEFINRA